MAYDLVARLKLIDKFTGPMKAVTASVKSMDDATHRAAASTTKVVSAATKMSGSFTKAASVTRDADKATKSYRDSNGKLSGQLGKVSNDAEKTSSSLKKVKSSLSGIGGTGGRIASPFGGMATGITALISAVGAYKTFSSALKLSSDAEQASIAFETMLGSADKSRKFLESLADFANKTPFELPQLRDSAKKMLAFGFSAEQVLPTLTAVGNAASGLGLGGDGIDRITLALGQMRAKSKVSGDEMLQLTEAGIPAWEILAKKMNTTTAAVMKMSEKGVIPADKAINALVEGMNAKFPNMMEKQSKTLAGLWSTMKDTFNNKLLVRFGDGIASALKPRFDALVRWIDANEATIDRWGATLQRVAGRAADVVAEKFTSVTLWFKKLNDDEYFRSLTWDQKLVEVVNRAFAALNNWLENNDEAINRITGNIVKIGVKLGTALGTAIIDGLLETLKTNELAAALAGGGTGAAIGSLFGPAGTFIGGVGGAAVGFSANKLHNASPYVQGEKYQGSVSSYIEREKRSDPSKPLLGETTLRGGTPTKRAGGLDRVPYNGFPIIAHKDERLQTKAEADATRNGRSGGGNVTVTGNTFVVRQESDIDAIARALAREMAGVH